MQHSLPQHDPAILLTSFFKSHEAIAKGYTPYSVAVYQPKGFNYPKLDFFDIRQNGRWIRPRDFIGEQYPLTKYQEVLERLYYTREAEIRAWKESLANYVNNDVRTNTTKVALCCWCPYDRAAQRQLQTHGTFVCHTAIIGKIIQQLQPGFMPGVGYDKDRDKMVKWRGFENAQIPRRP